MRCPTETTDDDDWDITTGVGLTAAGVAAARAAETARTDRLCHDPYAAALTTAADTPMPLPTRLVEPTEPGWDSELSDLWETMVTHMGLRTRFFDDYLTGATESGVHQVVLLAAGLDTRAHRLDWPAGTNVFELDQPQVLEFKDRVLTEQDATHPNCLRCVVTVDLRADWPTALRQAGFDPHAPTAWLAEGLLPYLPEQAERDLFTRITSLSAPGSRLGTHESHDLAAHESDPRWTRLVECFGIDPAHWMHAEATRPDPHDWFSHHGWDTSNTTGAELGARYDRPLTPDTTDLFAARSHYYIAHLPQHAHRAGDFR